MLNEEKIKSMTKAAAYEKGPEKKNIEISNYFRSDYMGLQLIKSAIAYTVSFCLIVGIWTMTGTEELMLQLTHADYIQRLLKLLAVLFVAGLLVYEIAVYIYYSWKYRKAAVSVDKFQSHLKKINKFYDKQEIQEEEIVDLDVSDEEMEV